MTEIWLLSGLTAMTAGVVLMSMGLYGWRPATEKTGGFFETPAALVGAFAWVLRFSLRVAGRPSRPRSVDRREVDVSPPLVTLERPAGRSTPPSAVSPAPAKKTAKKATGTRRRKRTGTSARRTAKAGAARAR